MEALQININVLLDMSEGMKGILQKVVGMPHVEPEAHRTTETAAQPALETKAEEVRTQEAKVAPEPEKVAEITDGALLEAVKAAKTRTSVKAVRAIFTEFGIGSSCECPQDRRMALLARLTTLEG